MSNTLRDRNGVPYQSPDGKPATNGTNVRTGGGGTGTMIGGKIVKK